MADDPAENNQIFLLNQFEHYSPWTRIISYSAECNSSALAMESRLSCSKPIVLSHKMTGLSFITVRSGMFHEILNHGNFNVVQASNKENIKVLHHWHFMRGIRQWLMVNLTKGR